MLGNFDSINIDLQGRDTNNEWAYLMYNVSTTNAPGVGIVLRETTWANLDSLRCYDYTDITGTFFLGVRVNEYKLTYLRGNKHNKVSIPENTKVYKIYTNYRST